MKIVHITGGHSKFPLSMGLKVPFGLSTLDSSDSATGAGTGATTNVRDLEMNKLKYWLKEVIIERIMGDYHLKMAFYYFGPQDISSWVFDDKYCTFRIPLGLAPPPKSYLELLPIQKNYPENVKKYIRKNKLFWWKEYAKNAMDDFGVDITIEIMDA